MPYAFIAGFAVGVGLYYAIKEESDVRPSPR